MDAIGRHRKISGLKDGLGDFINAASLADEFALVTIAIPHRACGTVKPPESEGLANQTRVEFDDTIFHVGINHSLPNQSGAVDSEVVLAAPHIGCSLIGAQRIHVLL